MDSSDLQDPLEVDSGNLKDYCVSIDDDEFLDSAVAEEGIIAANATSDVVLTGMELELKQEEIILQNEEINENEVHIKYEVDDEESTALEKSASLDIRDIPTNDGLDIKEWSMFGEFSKEKEEFAESNENFEPNDIMGQDNNKLVENTHLSHLRKFSTQNQLNINISEEGPIEMAKFGRGKPESRLSEGYSCDICRKCFSTKQNITRHMTTHSAERQYVCEKCNKGFKLSDKFKLHQLMHRKYELLGTSGKNKKNFRCTTCKRCYSSKKSLNMHSKVHTSEYECYICHRRFDRKSKMDRHVITHSDERPFVCGICDSSFNRKDHLQAHIQIHSDVKDFRCLTCDRKFKTKHGLCKHKLLHFK